MALEQPRTWRPFMSRTCRLNSSLVPLAALAAVFTLACHRAEAQVVPFKVVGGGVAPDRLPLETDVAAPHWAVGVATGLGEYFGQGAFQVLQFTSETTGVFDSAEPFVFVGADGSELACTYGDTSNGAKEAGEF